MSIHESRIDEFLDDIRNGITDSDLIEKYQIPAKVLKALFNKFFDERKIAGAEVYWRPLMSDESADNESRRILPRYLVASLIPVHYPENPKLRGWIFDLNEKGMRIYGLEATPGETRTLIFSIRTGKNPTEITMNAECRWSVQEEFHRITGFRITDISSDNLLKLRELIRQMTLCDFR